MIDRNLYGGQHIVYLTNYPDRESELYRKEPAELLEEFVPYLQRLNPDFKRDWVVEYYHHRVDGAQPIIGVNYSERIPGPPDAVPVAIPGEHDADLPGRPGHQLLGTHGPSGGADGFGGLGS